MIFVMTIQPAAAKVEAETDNDDLTSVLLTIKRKARGWYMPNADMNSLFHGLSLGTVPLEHRAYVQDLVEDLFPQHHLTFVHTRDEMEVFVYPRLTTEEQERWDKVFETFCRESALEL